MQVSFYRHQSSRKGIPELLPAQTSSCPGEVTWRLNEFRDDVISQTLDRSAPRMLEVAAKPLDKSKAYFLHFYHNMKDGCETLPRKYNQPVVSTRVVTLEEY